MLTTQLEGMKTMEPTQVSHFPVAPGLGQFRRELSKLSEQCDLHEACVLIATGLDRMGLRVCAITFVDDQGENPSVRPYRNQPEPLVQISLELQKSGTCPIIRHARTFGEVFDAKVLSLSDQTDFLAKRYLDELRKLACKQILVFPVRFGRGIAVFSIGTGNRTHDTASMEALHLELTLAVVALLSRFPDLARLFAPKTLSLMETQALFLLSSGATNSELSRVFDLSEIAVQQILRSACRKLNANSVVHAVSKAQRLGEIRHLDIGEHDLL